MPEVQRTRPPPFKPRFTLGLFYLAGFFILYSVLLLVPDLWHLVEPASPQQQEAIERAAFEAAREAGRARLLLALALSLASVGLGMRAKLLPGFR